jgi:hypothetical protein
MLFLFEFWIGGYPMPPKDHTATRMVYSVNYAATSLCTIRFCQLESE